MENGNTASQKEKPSPSNIDAWVNCASLDIVPWESPSIHPASKITGRAIAWKMKNRNIPAPAS